MTGKSHLKGSVRNPRKISESLMKSSSECFSKYLGTRNTYELWWLRDCLTARFLYDLGVIPLLAMIRSLMILIYTNPFYLPL